MEFPILPMSADAKAQIIKDIFGIEECLDVTFLQRSVAYVFDCGLAISADLVFRLGKDGYIEPTAQACKNAHRAHHFSCMALDPMAHGQLWNITVQVHSDEKGFDSYTAWCS